MLRTRQATVHSFSQIQTRVIGSASKSTSWGHAASACHICERKRVIEYGPRHAYIFASTNAPSNLVPWRADNLDRWRGPAPRMFHTLSTIPIKNSIAWRAVNLNCWPKATARLLHTLPYSPRFKNSIAWRVSSLNLWRKTAPRPLRTLPSLQTALQKQLRVACQHARSLAGHACSLHNLHPSSHFKQPLRLACREYRSLAEERHTLAPPRVRLEFELAQRA